MRLNRFPDEISELFDLFLLCKLDSYFYDELGIHGIILFTRVYNSTNLKTTFEYIVLAYHCLQWYTVKYYKANTLLFK